MSIIFYILMIASTLTLIFISPNTFLQTTSSATHKALALAVSLTCVYIFWCAILEVAKQAGITQKIAKWLSPLIRKLFGKVSEKAEESMATSLSANMLGFGGAATLPAIDAIAELENNPQTKKEKEQIKKGKVTYPMIMLFMLAATSIQLLPTTVISMLASAGASNAGGIILPGLITSLFTTLLGIVLVRFCK